MYQQYVHVLKRNYQQYVHVRKRNYLIIKNFLQKHKMCNLMSCKSSSMKPINLVLRALTSGLKLNSVPRQHHISFNTFTLTKKKHPQK